MIGKGIGASMAGGISRGVGHMGLGVIAGPWGMLVQLGLVLLAIAIVYFVVVNRKKNASEKSIMEPLKMKLVEGEITEEEYYKRKEIVLGK